MIDPPQGSVNFFITKSMLSLFSLCMIVMKEMCRDILNDHQKKKDNACSQSGNQGKKEINNSWTQAI